MMCLTIFISDDDLVENEETFIVTLTLMSTGIQLGQTIITIQDDEGKDYYIPPYNRANALLSNLPSMIFSPRTQFIC